MSQTAKYQVSVWVDGEPEPITNTVVIPEEWGTAGAFIEQITDDLKDLQADGQVDRYYITPLDCNDMQPHEMREWIQSLGKEGEQ